MTKGSVPDTLISIPNALLRYDYWKKVDDGTGR